MVLALLKKRMFLTKKAVPLVMCAELQVVLQETRKQIRGVPKYDLDTFKAGPPP